MPNFAISIFLSAFLLFQMQPMVGKFLLPRFGGTPSVWAVWMFFFQVALVLGYGYSHWLSRALNSNRQTRLRLGLLVFSFVWLVLQYAAGQTRLLPEVSRNLEAHETPALSALRLLAVHAGLPFFILRATSPLLQSWLTLAYPFLIPLAPDLTIPAYETSLYTESMGATS